MLHDQMICSVKHVGEEHVCGGGNEHNLLGTDIFLHIFHTYNTGVLASGIFVTTTDL